MKSTVVDESLSSFKPMYCSREYQVSTRLSQQYEKSTSNSLELYVYEKEAYFHQLEEILDKNTMKECQEFINRVIEARHERVLDHQRSKFESMYQWKPSVCSNMGSCSNSNPNSKCAISNQQTNNNEGNSTTHTWVKILSDIPLTEAQECLLAHGPNFVVIPRSLPKGECIVAIEQACTKLNQGEHTKEDPNAQDQHHHRRDKSHQRGKKGWQQNDPDHR